MFSNHFVSKPTQLQSQTNEIRVKLKGRQYLDFITESTILPSPVDEGNKMKNHLDFMADSKNNIIQYH